MKTLFELPEKIKKVMKEEKCKSCKYFTWIEYYSSRKIFYCKLRKSNRTENGLLKIKANQEACFGYKKVISKL